MGKTGRRILAALALTGLACAAPARAEPPPARVVSINVCTDQYAMLIAGEGQLHSVSHLAADPYSSAMVEEAKAFAVNHGLAEEVFLMRPDLVLAGTYTARATVDLLRRLGFRVELFDPVSDFDDVREQMTRIGVLLQRGERAAELVAELDAGLADLATGATGKTAISWSSNSYATGAGTFTDAVMQAAGLTNVLAERGVYGGARVPLETLLGEKPDLVVTSAVAYDRPALAQENFSHPAFRGYFGADRRVSVPDAYWICGAPFTLEAVRILRGAAGTEK